MYTNIIVDIECKRCFNKMKQIPNNDNLMAFEEGWYCCPECFTRLFIKPVQEKEVA